MAEFSLSDLAEETGGNVANFAIKAANRGADFVCGVYKDYPGFFIQNPVSSFVKGTWDTLCKDRPGGLPQAPSPPFSGGQCQCIAYSVAMQYDVEQLSTGNQTPNQNLTREVNGAIGGVRLVTVSYQPSAVIQLLCRGSAGTSCVEPFWQDQYTTGSENTVVKAVRIISLSRLDGLPDNCGSLPAEYDTSPPPAGRLTGDTTITHNDGTQITLPIVYAPISGSLPITVGLGGVPLSFDLGGVKIGGGGEDDLDQRLADLDAALDRLEQKELIRSEKEKNSPINEEDLETGPPDEVKEKEGIDRLAYVEISLSVIPQNAKRQFGVGAPNVLYAGWFEFKKGIACFPREGIQFQKTVFKAPIGADGFAYTLYTGFVGSSKVTKFKPNEDET